MKSYVLSFLLVFSIFSHLSESVENNGNKLGDVMKNHTRSVYNFTKTQQNDEESLLKQETHKLLSECGGVSDNNYDDDDYNNRDSNKPRKGNKNYNYGNSNRRRNSNRRYNNRDSNESGEYGNNRYNNQGNRYSNYGNDDDDNDSNNSNRYGNGRNRGNRYGNKRYNNENYSEEDNSDESDQNSSNNRKTGMRRFNRTSSSNNRNGYNNKNDNGYTNGYNEYSNDCKDETRGYFDGNNRNQWKPYGGTYGYDGRNYGYGNYGNNGNMRRGVTGPGYSRNFDINLRAKRSNNNDYDSQCVSQCVFGYLEVLDDNRVPSETLTIKWLQDRLSNDMKRIRALREARRCFARLSTSDIEDGCEFSKSLSKCLNLELE